MGEVFEARHLGLNKLVVVKLLHEAIAADPRYADRLRVEAQTLASVESPYLVSVSDIGCTPENRPYFVMERLHGVTLRRELERSGPLPPADALRWTIQTLTGLAAAHRLGIVHRDVKLDNLFLCDATPERGRVLKVLDFGVAKVFQSAGLPFPGPKYATEEKAIVGSPRYVSPEQICFEPVDARTDVYAAGVVLYTLLVGHGPFPDAEDMLELLNAHLLEVPPPPSRVAPQPIPPELDRAILRALAKRPEARFPSAEGFAEELERLTRLLGDHTLLLGRDAAPAPEDAPTPALGDDPATPSERTKRGTWIMAPPSSARPAAPVDRSGATLRSGGVPLAVLPEELEAPPAGAPGTDGRIFAALVIASTAFFSAIVFTILRLTGVLE